MQKQFISAIHGLSFLFTLSTMLLLPVRAGIYSGTPESRRGVVSRREFEALNATVAGLNSTVATLNSTVAALKLEVDVLLTLLAKDGPFALDFRSSRGQRGVQGSPGPLVNSTDILARLEELEKFRDEVELAVFSATQDPTVIYFATNGSGIRVYYEATNKVETLVASTEDLEGVAWDDENQQLYYCSHSTIYRVNGDGTQIQAVFNGTNYEEIRGLAIDWITGNLYGVGTGGCVFVCATATSGQINCRTLLSGQGAINGIALDPNSGTLYFTKNEGNITVAEMDGTNAVDIITGLSRPAGIAIGFDPLRLFWVDHATDRVKSSNLEGTDLRQVAQLPSGTYPWGIAIKKDRLFWGNYAFNCLQSSAKSGENLETLYSGTFEIQHLVVPSSSPARTRRNDCEGQSCPGICVLNKNSFRCLP